MSQHRIQLILAINLILLTLLACGGGQPSLTPALRDEPLIVEHYDGPTPDGARQRLGRGAFDDVALSSDGGLLAVASHLGVYVYETDTMTERWFYPTTSKMRSITISPDDSLIAAGELGSPVIHILNTQTGELLAALEGHDLGICDLEFSPDGRLLASASYDDQVIVWNTRRWEIERIIEGDATGTNGLALSPSGNLLATVADSGLITLVEVDTGEVRRELTTDEHLPYGAAWSPTDDVLVTGANNTALLWDVNAGTLVDTIEGFADRVERLDFSPDGRSLLIGSQGDMGMLWDVDDERVIEEFEAHVVDFSADGRYYVTGSFDNDLTFAWAETNQPQAIIHGHNDDILNIDWLPDGSLITTTHLVGAQRWALDGSGMQTLFDAPQWAYHLTVVDDGRYVGIGGRTSFAVYDRASGDQLWAMEGEADSDISSSAISPSNTLIALGYAQHVDLYDVQSGNLLHTLDEAGHALAFHDDDHLLIGGRGTIALWDIEADEVVYKVSMHTGLTVALALDAEAGQGISLGLDHQIVVWHADDGTIIRGFAVGMVNPNRIALSGDGRWLAVGDNAGDVALLDAQTGSALTLFRGHVTPITDLLFTPDNTSLISAAIDGTLVVWELPD